MATTTDIFLVWENPLESVVTDYEVVWTSNECPGSEIEEQTNISGTHSNYTINDLRPGRSYNVSLTASNNAGSSEQTSVTMTIETAGE